MLGIVSDDEFDDDLNDSFISHGKNSLADEIRDRFKPEDGFIESKINRGQVIDKASPGRASGDNNLPSSLRKIIGEDAAINGSVDCKHGLAGPLGVSNSSISAYKNGATSTASYDERKPDLLAHINRGKEVAIKRATHKMKLALSHITPDKLEATKARDLAGVAKDMSVIIKNLEPEQVSETKNVVFQFFAPQPRTIDSYSTTVLDED